MNASVLVSLTNRASAGLKMIGKDAQDAQNRVEALKNLQVTGFGLAGAGVAGLAAMGVAAKETLQTAGQLQTAMKSFEINAFGQALLPNANPAVIKNVIDQAQQIAKAKSIVVDIKTAPAAMSHIKKWVDQLAIEMGEKTIFGRKDATESFDALQKNGVALVDVLTGAGAATMYMAQITKQAPREAADDISKMAASYQLVGQQVMDLADTIVKVDGASSATAQNVAIGFKYAGGTARTLGVQYRDLAVAIGSLNSRGLDGSTAGTALNNMLLALAAPTDKATSALNSVGLAIDSFKGADGKIKPLQQVVDLVKNATRNLDTFKQAEFFKSVFGEEGARAVLALLENGQGSMAEIRRQMQYSLSITDRAAEANKTYESSIQRAQEAWENIKASLGTPFLDAAAKGMDFLARKLAGFAQVIQNNPEMLKMIVVTASLISALLVVAGTATAGAAAFGLLRIGLAASGASVLGVVGTVASLALRMGALGLAAWAIYRNWDTIAPYLKAFWTGLKDEATPVVEWFGSSVVPVARAVGEGISSAFQSASSALSQYWPAIEKCLGFTKTINSATHGEVKITWHMPDWAKWVGGFLGVMAAGKLLDVTVFGLIRSVSLFGILGNGVAGRFQSMRYVWWLFRNTTTATSLFVAIMRRIPGGSALLSIGRGALWVSGHLRTAVLFLWRASGGLRGLLVVARAAGLIMFGIGRGLAAPFVLLARGIGVGILWIARFGGRLAWLAAQALWMGARMAAAWLIALGPVGWIIAGVTVLIGAAVLAWNTNFLGFRDRVQSVVGTVKGYLSSFGSWVTNAREWGGNLITSFINGIKSKIASIPDALKEAASTVAAWLGVHSPTKEGPLRTNHLWGGNLALSFADGMQQNIGAIKAASQRSAQAVSLPQSIERPNMQTPNRSSGLSPGLVGAAGGGTVRIEQHNEFKISGGDPEELQAEFQRQLNESNSQLLRQFDQMLNRRKLNAARFEPGAIT